MAKVTLGQASIRRVDADIKMSMHTFPNSKCVK